MDDAQPGPKLLFSVAFYCARRTKTGAGAGGGKVGTVPQRRPRLLSFKYCSFLFPSHHSCPPGTLKCRSLC